MGKKILIVDDNEDSRELIGKVLRARGYEVVEAMDGREALEKAAAVPALILMDISIPMIDGYEVTRRLKKDPKLGAIPIIAVTAHAMKGDREKALAAGCDDYIAKPIDIRQLAAQLAPFLGN